MNDNYDCGIGCAMGGADDCFWWKGHESCEHFKTMSVKIPDSVEEFKIALHDAYLAGAYTERTGTFNFWYDENYSI